MKNKKIVSMIVMFSIFINIISGLHIDAQAENTENSETYLWDFSKYTDKITTTKTGFTEKYDGLTIAIADNGDDSISTGGVYWRGGTSSGESTTRYISYTPTKNGTLSATGKLNATGGRWGISTFLNVGTFVAVLTVQQPHLHCLTTQLKKAVLWRQVMSADFRVHLSL